MVDNVSEATDQGDDSVDFSRVKDPIKQRMKVYDVEYSEAGWERVYRAGTTEVPAWDEDDAYEVGINWFHDYGGETEWTDGGDYDVDDSDAEVGEVQRVLEQKKKMK